MQFWIFTAEEIAFVWKLLASLSAGIIIGMERELRGKPAGISTHSLVIGGSMIFTALSIHMDPNSPARIAAQVVSGIGFLGAGMILKGKSEKIKISLPREHLVCGFDWHEYRFRMVPDSCSGDFVQRFGSADPAIQIQRPVPAQ